MPISSTKQQTTDMRVDVQFDWSVRDVQCCFHRCDAKTVFPIICDLPRSLRISGKTNSHWYVLEDTPSGFPGSTHLRVTVKRTCLDAGFLMAKWNLFCCYCLFSHLLAQLSLCVFVCKVVLLVLMLFVPCCHRMMSLCKVTKELLQRSIQQGLQRDWEV